MKSLIDTYFQSIAKFVDNDGSAYEYTTTRTPLIVSLSLTLLTIVRDLEINDY